MAELLAMPWEMLSELLLVTVRAAFWELMTALDQVQVWELQPVMEMDV